MSEILATGVVWIMNGVAAIIFLTIAGIMAYWSYQFTIALLMDLKIIRRKRDLDQHDYYRIWWDQ
ncbi:hypothetical protein [Nitrosomonas mobilis]|uniref:hypothetical protein n=1 Tax=Nitrosomonas mobilis TaxID=51642 RepID=UPI000B7FDC76|nr:hypothetical protein [Nitrosomonas mobilis]